MNIFGSFPGDHAPLPAEQVQLTGTTSQANATAFEIGRAYMLINDNATEVCIRFGPSTPTATAADIPIAKGQGFYWMCRPGSQFVAAFPADGSSTFRCVVIPITPQKM